MKTSPLSRSISTLLVGALLTISAAGATVTWDADTSFANGAQDGAGNWDTSSLHWRGASANAAWNNAGNDTAVFGSNSGAAGTVTLTVPITVGGLTFNAAASGSYTITGQPITLSGAVVINANVDATISSQFTVGGSLVKTGSGALTLSSANGHTSTTISAGTLRINSSGAIGSGNVINNSALVFVSALTVANTISGTGTVAKEGNGTATLTSANNSYSGGTTLSGAGVLGVGHANALGTGSITFNGGTLRYVGITTDFSNRFLPIPTGVRANIDTNGEVVTLASPISGPGGLIATGSGALILTGANTYGENTIVNAESTLQVGNGGTSGTVGAGNIAPFGAIAFNRSDTVTVSSSLSANGVLSQIGTGTLILTGSGGSFTGATRIRSGTLVITANTGASMITLGDASTGASPMTFLRSGGALSSPITVAAGNTGVASVGSTVDGIGQFTGTVTLNHDVTLVGNNVTDSGPQHSSPKTSFEADITGNGNVTIGGTGLVQFRGPKTYNGTTTVNPGAIFSIWNSNSLPVGSDLIVNGTASAEGLINGLTLGRLSGSGILDGNFNWGFSNISIGANGVSSTFAGKITSAVHLTKNGVGTITLSGNNTYTGQTTINEGTLQIGDGGPSGTIGVGTVTNNSALVFNRSDFAGFGGVIMGTGSLTTIGSGTVVLNGSNTYTGGTTINAGSTLQVGDGGASGALGTGSIVTNGMLAFNRSDALSESRSISGSGGLRHFGAGVLTLTGANSYSGATTVDAGSTLQLGDGGATGEIVSSVVNNNGTLIFNRSNAVTFAGSINGAGSVVKTGAGSLALIGTSSHTGPTIIVSGSLTVDGDKFNATSGITIAPDASDAIFIFDDTVSNDRPIATSGVGVGKAILQATNPADGFSVMTLNSAMTLNRPTTIRAMFANSGRLTITGAINGTVGALTVDGGGRVTLDNQGNNFLGNVFVADNGTILQTNAPEALPDQSVLTLATGTNFYFAADPGALNTETIMALQGSGNVQNHPSVPHPHTLVVGFGDGNGAFSGTIQNGGGVISFRKIGEGIQTLLGSNSYTGTTTLAGGTLGVGNANALGFADILFSGGTLRFDGISTDFSARFDPIGSGNLVRIDTNGQNVTFASGITGSGGLSQSGAGSLTLAGMNTYTGPTTIGVGSTLLVGNGGASGTLGSGNVVTFGTLGFNRSDAVTVSAPISGSGGLNKAGAGSLTLTGINTYAGVTSINAGKLQVGAGGNSGNLGPNAIQNNGILSFNRADILSIANLVTGSGLLEQNGLGTLVLTNSNTYSGGTTVNEGTLLANTVGATGTGSVSVSILGTLGGTGTITPTGTSNVTIGTLGRVSPGASIGTLTIDSLNTTATNVMSFAAGAKLVIELANVFLSDKVSLINAGNNDVLFNTNTVDFIDLAGGNLAAGNYTIFSATGAADPYDGLTVESDGTISAGMQIGLGLQNYDPSTSLKLVGNDIVLHLVPEPSVGLALLSGLGVLLGWRRRR